MKESLKVGIRTQKLVVPKSKTVPAFHPEAEEFIIMPEVFDIGFLVACLNGRTLKPSNHT